MHAGMPFPLYGSLQGLFKKHLQPGKVGRAGSTDQMGATILEEREGGGGGLVSRSASTRKR